MTKVILIGSPQCQWDIEGHMKPGGTVLELTDSEINKHKDVVREIIKEAPKPSEQKKYTKKSLEELYEKKGIEGLRKVAKKFKVKFRSIDEGIREILEAQK